MANPLLGLQQELLTMILLELHFEDIVSLKKASRGLFNRLSSEENSSDILKNNLRYSQEVNESTCSSAVRRASTRKQAFALARPRSAIVLGYGKSFLYQEGFLCYVHKETIRILDVLYGSKEECIIDLRMLFLQGVKGWDAITAVSDFATAWFEVEILQCEAGILSVLVAGEETSCLMAFDYRPEVVVTDTFQGRVRLVLRGAWPGTMMGGPRPGIGVRHTERFLYYISNHRQDGHDSWAITMRPFDAETNGAFPEMRDLFLTGPGESIAVKINYGWIYVLSNQSKIAHVDENDRITLIEEDDPKSYYQCYRFRTDDFRIACRKPFDSTPSTLEMVGIWRRQPKAGPNYNTSWADLTLHEDECTGDLVIVEARQAAECGNSPSGPISYEFQPLNFEHPVDYGDMPSLSVTHRTVIGKAEAGYHIQGQHDKPYGRPPHHRPRYETSTEPASEGHLPRLSPIPSTKGPLKHRAYNLSCHSFLDLFLRDKIHDHRLSNSGQPIHDDQQVHIEIGSRTRASPVNEETGLLTSQERFIDGEIQTWPPPNAPDALIQLLNPYTSRHCDLRADSDERSIVYMVGPVDGQPRRKPMKKGLKYSIGDLTCDGPNGFKIGDVFKGEGISGAPVGSGERVLRYWPAQEVENGVIIDGVLEIPVNESMRLREEDVEGQAQSDEIAEHNNAQDHDPIVFINFDAKHFKGFEKMRLGPHTQNDNVSTIMNRPAEKSISVDKGTGKEPEGERKEPEAKDGDRQWFRREPAMWVGIREGFEFVYED